MENLNRTIKIEVKGRSYEITFPTIGQYREIETRKNLLSLGSYKSMSAQNFVGTNKALDIIDIDSHFSVLAPQLIKDLGRPFDELTFEELTEIETAYKEVFVPWYNQWFEKIVNRG